ncbi:MAG: hypothetical protein QOF21_1534 [Actinomycetota bacterium]
MSDEATDAATLVSDMVQVWLGELQRFYDRTQDPDATWDAEAFTSEASRTIENVMPVVKRGAGLTLDLLRPWSSAFQKRASDG